MVALACWLIMPKIVQLDILSGPSGERIWWPFSIGVETMRSLPIGFLCVSSYWYGWRALQLWDLPRPITHDFKLMSMRNSHTILLSGFLVGDTHDLQFNWRKFVFINVGVYFWNIDLIWLGAFLRWRRLTNYKIPRFGPEISIGIIPVFCSSSRVHVVSCADGRRLVSTFSSITISRKVWEAQLRV